MVAKRENSAIIAGFCILIVITVSIAACTVPESKTNNPVKSSIPASEISEPATTQVQAIQPVTTGNRNRIQNQQPEEPVSLTINSARKMARVVSNSHRRDENIYVVLDITVKNNDVQEGFDFANTSIVLFDPTSGKRFNRTLNLNPSIQIALENPLILPTKIAQNEALTGQIIFKIIDSTGYRLTLIDSDKKVLTSLPINFDGLTTASNPVDVTINSVEKRWSLNTTRPGPGDVFVILNITVKNNDLPDGFYFIGESTTLWDPVGGRNVDFSFNEKDNVQEGLENAIILPRKIKQNETITGKILFGTTSSNTYLLNLVDNKNTIILSRTINAG